MSALKMPGRWRMMIGLLLEPAVSIPTTSPFTIKLNELEDMEAQRDEKIEEFRQLNQEAFAAAKQARIDNMPAEILEYWQKPESELTPEQQRQLMPSILKGLVPDLS